MKKILALLICVLVAATSLLLPAAADTADAEQILVSQTIEYLGNDTYYVESIYVPAVEAYSNTKTGTKVAECISSGTTLFTLAVTGTFTYDGETSEAISATGKITAFVEGITTVDRSAYVIGNSAYAYAHLKYEGVQFKRTVKLTCDKDGVLR